METFDKVKDESRFKTTFGYNYGTVNASIEETETFYYNSAPYPDYVTRDYEVNVVEEIVASLFLDGAKIAEERFLMDDAISEAIEHYAAQIENGLKDIFNVDDAQDFVYNAIEMESDPILCANDGLSKCDVLPDKFTLEQLLEVINNLKISDGIRTSVTVLQYQ